MSLISISDFQKGGLTGGKQVKGITDPDNRPQYIDVYLTSWWHTDQEEMKTSGSVLQGVRVRGHGIS